HLVGHGLLQEVFGVFPVQLGIEAQQVLLQVRHAGLLATQPQADLGARETALEEGLGLAIALFDTRLQLFGHGGLPETQARHYTGPGGPIRDTRRAGYRVHTGPVPMPQMATEAASLARSTPSPPASPELANRKPSSGWMPMKVGKPTYSR